MTPPGKRPETYNERRERLRRTVTFKHFGGDHFPGFESVERMVDLLTERETRNIMSKRYPIHPLASVFPAMADDEFKALKESIKQTGLREPIVLFEDQILEGRNREEACFQLKMPPIFRQYDASTDGEFLIDFVTDMNLNRRHLTPGQKATLAVDLEPYFTEKFAKQKAQKAAKVAADKKAKAAKAAAEKAAKSSPPEIPESSEKPAFDSIPPAPLSWEDVTKHHANHDAGFMEGVRAAFDGKPEDECPHREGTGAHAKWMDGFDAETLRYETLQAEKEAAEAAAGNVTILENDKIDDDDDLVIGTKSAAAAAAAATGASERSTHRAKDLKNLDPEGFKDVAAGKSNLNTAVEAAKNKAEATKRDPYRHECADMIEASHGEEISNAIRNSTILKKTGELEKFMALTVPDQQKVIPFIAKSWQLADALKFIRGEFDNDTSVATLMAFANAANGEATVTIEGFTFTIKRLK